MSLFLFVGLDSDDHLDLGHVAQVQKFHGPFFGLYAYNCGARFGPQFCHAILPGGKPLHSGPLRKGAACCRTFYETARVLPQPKRFLWTFALQLKGRRMLGCLYRSAPGVGRRVCAKVLNGTPARGFASVLAPYHESRPVPDR